MMELRNCKQGDDIRPDLYEAMVNFETPCIKMARKPSHLQGLYSKHGRSVQASAGSVMVGEGVGGERGGQHEGVPLSAGFIAVVCICGILILFLSVFSSELKGSISTCLRRRRQNTWISSRRDVHGNPSRAVRPEDHAELSNPNPSEVQSSNGSSAMAGLNTAPPAGWKQGLAYWVIKGLPLIRYKKQKVQLHPARAIMSSNSASSLDFIISQSMYQNSTGMMIAAPATLDHDIEGAQLPADEAVYNEYAAPDHYNRLECVVCLSPFEDDEAVRVLPQCYHAFHAVCIDSWLLLHSTCPLCRALVSSSDGSLQE